MSDPKRRFDIDYTRILAQRLQSVPAWRDLAGACNEVLGKEVDERRRRLEKIRDSVKYRRGDTLVNVVYEPETDKLGKVEGTNALAEVPIGTVIKTAKVKNVIKNIAYYLHSDSKDYLDLSFVYKNQTIRWLKPIDIPQERDALLKNSYIMGFDFFNNKLNDEDLQRLYETIQMYWPESGSSDNFMKYIGFIKNARFDLIPLWSYETEEDVYPLLEIKPNNELSVKDGGDWYLTSHVEIRYDLAQFGEIYPLNLDDLESLFYYFAPIILVLERIVGSLEIESTIAVLSVNDLVIDNYGVEDNPTEFAIKSLKDFNAVDASIINWEKIELPTHLGRAPNSITLAADTVIANYDEFSFITDTKTDLTFYGYISSAIHQTVYDYAMIDRINVGSRPDNPETTSVAKGQAFSVVSNNYGIIKTAISL